VRILMEAGRVEASLRYEAREVAAHSYIGLEAAIDVTDASDAHQPCKMVCQSVCGLLRKVSGGPRARVCLSRSRAKTEWRFAE
jgi:hypothetical protein